MNLYCVLSICFILFSIQNTLQISTTKQLSYDIVIYGATPGGLTAAIGAANTTKGLSIAIIEPEQNFGGMVVAGGIGLRDLGDTSAFGGIGLIWTEMNAKSYNVNYRVYQPDMYIGRENWQKLLSEFPSIELFMNEPILESEGNVIKSGEKIISFKTGINSEIKEWQGKVFIDASYEGDLARFANVSYTFGRESKDAYNEKYAGVLEKTGTGNFLSDYPVKATLTNGSLIPNIASGELKPVGSGDDKMMGYSYRLCITKNKANQAPFPKPENYNRDDFVLLQRYLDSLVQSGKYSSGPPFSYLVDVLDYRSYPKGDKYDLCDSANSAVTSDVIGMNVGYVEATREQRKVIAKKHYDYLMGYIYFLTNDSSVPEYTKSNTLEYGLCKDQWVNNSHIPTQLYVREGLRIIGEKVISWNDIVCGTHINDSIGVGSWIVDIHVVERVAIKDEKGELVADNEGQKVVSNLGSGRVYELPYSLLLPKRNETNNLLVPVTHSATHLAYSSTRVEPTFVQLGQASGCAAALFVEKSYSSVQDVEIKVLQEVLVQQGMKIRYDS